MTELFEGKDQEPKVVKNEDGSFVIGSKKYKDIDALLNSKVEADRHIGLLEEEGKENRTMLQQREEELTLLKKLDERLHRETPRREEIDEDLDYERPGQREPQQANLSDPDEIVDKVTKRLEDNATKQRLRDQFDLNKRQVSDAIVEAFAGDEDEAREAFEVYKKSADYDEDIFNSMMLKQPQKLAKEIVASKDPSAVANYGNVPTSRPKSTKNMGDSKGWSYFKKLLNENRRQYYTPEVQQELRANRERLGDRFMKL